MGDKKKDKMCVTLWELYLTKEIGIEFKACLYFFAILFFYCIVRIIGGSFVADMLHMLEMILVCYAIGYIQVYLLWNFDEADNLGGKEFFGMVICTLVYSILSYVFSWFDKKLVATLIFAAYLMLTYICVFFIYKSKRYIDDKRLNEDLRIFQSEHKK